MKSYTLLLLFACCLLPMSMAAIAQQQKSESHKSMETPEAQLLRQCRNMLFQMQLNHPESTEEAVRYFDAMSPPQRTQRLVTLCKSLYRGTSSYASVSYVIAYYGIEVAPNLGRMLEWIYPPKTTPATVLAKDSEQNMKEGFDDGMVWGGVGIVLRRHISDAVIKQIFKANLVAEELGSASESPGSMLAGCFVDYPARTLRVAAEMDNSDHVISLLARNLAHEGGDWNLYHEGKSKSGDYSKERKALQALVNSQDHELMRAARKCRSRFEQEVPKS